MSIEIGRSVYPVFVSRPENEAGISYGDIEYMAQELSEGEQRFPELEQALERVLTSARKHHEVVGEMHEEGIYLLGIQALKGHSMNMGGLFYGQGKNGDHDSGYSEVAIGTWMSWTRLEHESEEVRAQLLSMAYNYLDSEDSHHWRNGVPVRRLTRILPIHPELPGSTAPEGYIFGHQLDLREIGRLAVPDSMKEYLIDSAKQMHMAELEDERKGLFTPSGLREQLNADDWLGRGQASPL